MSCSSAASRRTRSGDCGRRVRLLQRDRLVQHGQRVGVDVLVLVVLVDLHPQRRQLRQDDVGQSGADEELQRRPRGVLQQGLRELDVDALGRDARELAGELAHRLDHLVVGGQLQLGDESHGPQHAQRVVGEGVPGGPRRAQPAGEQVAQPAERVGHRPVGAERDRHGVHREVAPEQVVDQRVAPGHLGIAGLPVVAVGPEGGDLQPDRARVGVHLGTDRAEGDPGVPRGTRPAAEHVQDLLGVGGGGDVDVAGHRVAAVLGPEQRVPHRPTDQVHLVPRRGEAPAELGEHGGEVDELPHGLLDSRGNRLGIRTGPIGPTPRHGPLLARSSLRCSRGCRRTTRGLGGHDEPA